MVFHVNASSSFIPGGTIRSYDYQRELPQIFGNAVFMSLYKADDKDGDKEEVIKIVVIISS